VPEPSTAIDAAFSLPAPQRYVPYKSPVPAAFSFTRNASSGPQAVVRKPFGETGKSAESVLPATYAFPAASTQIACPRAPRVPPRKLE